MEPFRPRPPRTNHWTGNTERKKPRYCDFYVFGVIDGEGEVQQDVCVETGDTICLEGWYPQDHHTEPGERWYFESDAYHLKQWAEENGMKAFKHGYMFDQLPEPHDKYEDE